MDPPSTTDDMDHEESKEETSLAETKDGAGDGMEVEEEEEKKEGKAEDDAKKEDDGYDAGAED